MIVSRLALPSECGLADRHANLFARPNLGLITLLSCTPIDIRTCK